MPTAAELEEFKTLFATKLREKITADGLSLADGQEAVIALEFIKSLLDYKTALENSAQDIIKVRGEIAWSAAKEKITADFALTLDKIFKSIGGINPKERAVFWSGLGLKRAEDSGLDFGNTIPGFVVNQVHTSLQEIFTKQAYTDDGLLDTAVNIGMWTAFSQLYAEGSEEKVHVFLVDGETSHQSVFWNTELKTLFERQRAGVIKEILVHHLTKFSLIRYRILLEERKNATNNPNKLLEVNQKIDNLLKNAANWTSENLESSTNFKLKTSGTTDSHKAASYQIVKEAGNKFKFLGAKKALRKLQAQAENKDQSEKVPADSSANNLGK